MEEGERVAVELGRSPWMIGAQLACWELGAIVISLEPDWPSARRERMLAVSQPSFAIVADENGDLQISQQKYGAKSLYDTEESRTDDAALCSSCHGLGWNDFVWVNHAALQARATNAALAYHLSPAERATWLGPAASAYGLGFAWSCLLSGTSLIIPDRGVEVRPDHLPRWLDRRQVSIVVVPMPLASILLGAFQDSGMPPRLIVVPCDPSHFPVQGKLASTVVLEFGDALTNCFSRVELDAHRQQSHPSIGVLDSAIRPRLVESDPDGTGMLEVAGPCTHRRIGAEETDFVDTGFLARPCETGPGFRFAGHATRKVDLHGRCVEWREIEDLLLSDKRINGIRLVDNEPLPSLRGATLELVTSDAVLRPSDIRERLLEWLPFTMVPPLRNILVSGSGSNHPDAPMDEAEAVPFVRQLPPANAALVASIRSIWKAVFDTADIAANTNFDDLDGSSLQAGMIVAEIEHRHGVRIPMAKLQHLKSPELQARFLTAKMRVRSTSPS